MQQRFDFPPSIHHYEVMESSQGLIETLARQIHSNLFLFGKKFNYYVSMKNPVILRAKCSQCPAYLAYRAQSKGQNDIFRLKTFRLSHCHIQKDRKTKQNLVVQFLRNHREYEANLYDLRQMVRKELNVSNQTFYRAVAQVEGNYKNNSFPHLLSFLEVQGETRYEPFPLLNGHPDSLIFVSPAMKQNYLRFGRSIYIDFTYNLVQDKRDDHRQWAAGFITGLNHLSQIKVYAISLASGQTTTNVAMILRNFFQIMGKQCQTIISDRGKGIIQGVKLLINQNEFDGYHLFDAFHLMKGIQSPSSLKKHFHALYRATDAEEYHQLLHQVSLKMQDNTERKCLAKFDSLSALFCIPFIPKTFVGTGVSTSPAEKFNDEVKKLIPRQQNYCSVFIKLEKVAAKMNKPRNYRRKKVEMDFSFIEGLPYLASNLCPRAFDLLLKQIFKGIHNSTFGKPQIEEHDGHIVCDCGLYQKTGLPCCHILKRLVCQGRNIRDHISDYWIRGEEQKQFPKPGQVTITTLKGRPRKTRRNK